MENLTHYETFKEPHVKKQVKESEAQDIIQESNTVILRVWIFSFVLLSCL